MELNKASERLSQLDINSIWKTGRGSIMVSSNDQGGRMDHQSSYPFLFRISFHLCRSLQVLDSAEFIARR